MIFIDTEFNRKLELLSLGVASNKILKEFYFKNQNKDKSYDTHGLSPSFLNKYGISQINLQHILESFKDSTIIGFDMDKDVQALGFIPSKIFKSKKVIDFKSIFYMFDYNPSIQTLSIATNTIKNNLLPLHTSAMDALILKNVFNFFLSFLINNNFSKEEIIEDFKEITEIVFEKHTWKYNLYQDKYHLLINLFEKLEINKKRIINLNFSKIYFSRSKDNILFFDNDKTIFAKYKYEDFNHFLLSSFEEIEFDDLYPNIGFKEFDFERIL